MVEKHEEVNKIVILLSVINCLRVCVLTLNIYHNP